MTLFEKLTSRKFMMAVATAGAGIAVSLGWLSGEQQDALV